MSNAIEFILDGKTVSAAPGQTILQVAAANNIAIPSLCYNEKVSKNTSCFVCVVKDLKSGRFLPSCSACPSPGQQIDASSPEVKDMRRTCLELLLSEHSGDCEAPCTIACPAHASVEEYVRAGRKGDFLECLRIVKQRIPLPMSIGRVCPRFCEKDCRKNIFGSPVAINDFKRLAADLYYDDYMEELAPETGRKVALVGGGPAGLAAAYFLRLAGVAVTIFDQMPEMGGMLRYGIPEYRLPKKAVLDRELAHFAKLGVKFENNRKLGDNLSMAELEAEFDAVGVTVGCWQASSMRCEGEELALQGIDFLRTIALKGWSGANPGRVIVVGGGNTAMDCVRTSVRLGSPEVRCFYRRTENEMPAEKIEIQEAREEGVKFEFLVAPVKIHRSGHHLVLTCQRMELGEPDASGRRRPVAVAGSEFEVEADTIIAAIGQSTLAPADVIIDKRGNIAVDEKSMQVSGRIFATGDCVSGAATVVEAVAGGRRLANGIISLLTGAELPVERAINVSRGYWRSMSKDEVLLLRRDVADSARVKQPLIALNERKQTFLEVAGTIGKEQMMAEGERCIECSCTAKGDCKLKKFSEEYCASPVAIKGEKLPLNYDNRHPVIIQDRGKCIKCGICVKVCKEVINQTLLSPKKRGFFTAVGTAFEQGLPQSCAECGACINECPVGALDWKIKQ
ncbi:FAD-dependent oxidoreductase [Victivallis sp. Marseille-Q1083]|uniref:FAD-dependent oxidoreductase n=1 Tax=Victivallis sp. Marseille-Q1083 TaxID=2717288 RepID=UPI001588D08B|nr:FAD-dependent oxidoreductase [Victivallis sp. Marseille-Q1083]